MLFQLILLAWYAVDTIHQMIMDGKKKQITTSSLVLGQLCSYGLLIFGGFFSHGLYWPQNTYIAIQIFSVGFLFLVRMFLPKIYEDALNTRYDGVINSIINALFLVLFIAGGYFSCFGWRF